MNNNSIEVKDGFIECPHCGNNLCYVQNINGEETWMCLGCGFSSTTLMKQGSETEQAVTVKQPRLYKDLSYIDKDNYVWYPAVVTVPDKGMVYISGTNLEDWEWAATPMRKLTSKEQRLRKYKGQKYVADMEHTTFFGKEGFIQAAESVGMFSED